MTSTSAGASVEERTLKRALLKAVAFGIWGKMVLTRRRAGIGYVAGILFPINSVAKAQLPS